MDDFSCSRDSMRSILSLVALISTTSLEKVHRFADFEALAYIIPLPLGPEIGMAKSACPDGPLTLMLPMTKIPASIGDPKALTTAGWDCAVARASLYTSDDFTMPKTIVTMSMRKAAKRARNPRQATGTNHFQFRCHHVRDFSWGTGGCVFGSISIRSPLDIGHGCYRVRGKERL